jgi:hypothetical protein
MQPVLGGWPVSHSPFQDKKTRLNNNVMYTASLPYLIDNKGLGIAAPLNLVVRRNKYGLLGVIDMSIITR